MFSYTCSRASGPRNTDCFLLIHRYRTEAGLRKDEAESWVFEHSEGTFFNRFGLDIYLSGLWRSPSGAVFVTGEDLIERVAPRSEGGGFSRFTPETIVSGVWGLSDDFVVAWGGDRDSGEDVNKMYVYDGKSWADMPAPECTRNGQWVNAVRGTAPDDLVAVGSFGLISHWDGREWRAAQVPLEAHFSGLHVESKHEMYACAPSGLIVEGSVNGWAQTFTTTEFQTQDIAKFADRIWVAGCDTGLLELVDDQLVVIKDNIPAKRVEATETLLATCEHVVACTEDGQGFMGTFIEKLPPLIEDARADLGW